MNAGNHIIIWILLVIMVSSCFEEDEMIDPHEPGNHISITLSSSMYEYQTYFDLGEATERAVIPNDSWMIGFDPAPEGWKIIVNSGGLWAVHPTGKYSFDDVTRVTDPALYHFDASSGNPDSCAFSRWLDRSKTPWEPTGEIFLVGKYSGAGYDPEYKIRFTGFSDTCYSFEYGPLDGQTSGHLIRKNSPSHMILVNLESGPVICDLVPSKDRWDLLFTQYGTIIFTNEGVPTPYYVRGVLLNPAGAAAYPESVDPWEEISWETVSEENLSAVQDEIGYQWKDVEVDVQSGTAIYYVRTDTSWIIRDTEGFFYKYRFTGFYSKKGEKGYPTFEFLAL